MAVQLRRAHQQPVSLTGSQLFEENSNSGLYVISSGQITAANLTARGNAIGAGSGYGAHLANDGAGSVGGITLTEPISSPATGAA